MSGNYKGIEAFMGFFSKTFELSGGTFKRDVHDVLANDDHGVGLTTASAQRGGKTWSDNQVNVFHFEGGKISEFWNHPSNVYAKDEFWT